MFYHFGILVLFVHTHDNLKTKTRYTNKYVEINESKIKKTKSLTLNNKKKKFPIKK
jgi:hypothetical protein